MQSQTEVNEQKLLVFVIAILYSLPAKWRGVGISSSFEDILRVRHEVSLHTAWRELHSEEAFGKFSNMFWFDSFRGTSNLGEILTSTTGPAGYVRMDGNNYELHLDQVDQKVIATLLRREKIAPQIIEFLSARLATLLEKQEARTHSPATT